MGEPAVSFRGTFTHSLDGKGRLTIPVRMRAGLEEGLVLTRGFGSYLVLYPEAVWNEQERIVNGLPRTSAERDVFTRWTFGGGVDVALDSLGRILIPDHLREYAGLGDQAVIVGANDAIEIWSVERHREIVMQDRDRLPEILKSLSEKSLL